MSQKFTFSCMGEEFPFLKIKQEGKKIIYFDNAATSQKPASLIEAMNSLYFESNANVHRASHYLSAQATKQFEEARSTVQKFINAKSSSEVIWTKGTTEAVNIVAQSWAMGHLSEGDEIVLSFAEHHANFVPWQVLAEQLGAKLVIAPLKKSGVIDLDKLPISKKTKLIAIHHISNVVGKINDIKAISNKAKQVGAKVFVDGAQSIGHVKVDVQMMGCDFFGFSGHKMFGPSGIGVLYGKKEILETMEPYQYGGEMISRVSIDKTEFNKLPFVFEAGTPNIAGAIGLAHACNMLTRWYQDNFEKVEKNLCHYLYQSLNSIPQVNMPFTGQADIPLACFTMEGINNHDIATTLDSEGIAVRSGHHCAMPLMTYLDTAGLVRVSLAPYNTEEEIDTLTRVLKKIVNQKGQEGTTESIITSNSYLGQDKILEKFLACKGWDGKHREIMLLGKQFPRLDKEFHSEEHLISGCESNAWLTSSYDSNHNILSFEADSNARVIRGLLHIVLSFYDGKTPQTIQDLDIESYFTQLGLLQHLSPSRGNGLLAIVKKIKLLAAQY